MHLSLIIQRIMTRLTLRMPAIIAPPRMVTPVPSIIHLPSIPAVPGTPPHNPADEPPQDRGVLCMHVVRVVGFGHEVRGVGTRKNGDSISVLSLIGR